MFAMALGCGFNASAARTALRDASRGMTQKRRNIIGGMLGVRMDLAMRKRAVSHGLVWSVPFRFRDLVINPRPPIFELMKSALITVAILFGILGGVWMFDRPAPGSGADPEKVFVEKVEEMRQAQERVEDSADGSPGDLAELVALVDDPRAALGERSSAVRKIATSGRDDMVPVIKRALAGKDKELREWAILGIADSFDEDPFREAKTSERLKEELFDLVAAHLQHHLEREKMSVIERFDIPRHRAIQVLPRMNLAKAAVLLQRPDILRVDSPDFLNLLETLSDAAIPLTLKLDGLLEEFHTKALGGEHHAQDVYGELLRAAATQKHAQAVERIQEALTSPDDLPVAENAAEAQWILLGLSPTLDTDIRIQADKMGADKLETPLRHYVIVRNYYDDSQASGLGEYFLSPFFDDIRTNVIALKEMGADMDAYRITQAMELFGANGPPADRAKRREMMEANDRRLLHLIDQVEAPGSIAFTQKYNAIVHAKLYLARHVEICKKLPRNYP